MHELEDAEAAARFIFETTLGTLKDGTEVDSCTSLLAKSDERLATIFEHLKKQGAPIACKAGCSFCCHLRVTVAPHEAIALYGYLMSEIPAPLADEIQQRILANAEQIGRLTPEEQVITNRRCAFLVDGSCSAYAARPMACALHHSLDVQACKQSYENPANHSIGIRRLALIERIKPAAQAGMRQALQKRGLSDEPMELHTALAAILRNRSLIERWRSGHPLLPQIE
jgi:Fe-S-cluster containining protein